MLTSNRDSVQKDARESSTNGWIPLQEPQGTDATVTTTDSSRDTTSNANRSFEKKNDDGFNSDSTDESIHAGESLLAIVTSLKVRPYKIRAAM